MAKKQDQSKVMSSAAIQGASRTASEKLGTFSSGFSVSSGFAVPRERSTKVNMRAAKKRTKSSLRSS